MIYDINILKKISNEVMEKLKTQDDFISYIQEKDKKELELLKKQIDSLISQDGKSLDDFNGSEIINLMKFGGYLDDFLKEDRNISKGLVIQKSSVNMGDNPSKYFADGKYNPNLLIEDIMQDKKIIYVRESGFYVFENYWRYVSEEIIKSIFMGKLGDRARAYMIEEATKLLKFKVLMSIEELNKDRNRLVLLNGTLDIFDWKKPKFFEDKFFYENYSTIQLHHNYNENAKCPKFNKFLYSTFENDEERIKLICEILGYCLTSDVRFDKSFIFYGEGGNGKSKIIGVIERLLTGANITSVSMSDLSKPFSRASLNNKLVNISTEQEGYIGDTGYLKKIISGDTIDAQYKFKDQFEFKPFCKMIFAMNKLPSTKDRSLGFYRRFIIVPFNKVFQEEEQDKNLSQKLEGELDGILQLALAGLKNLAVNGQFTNSSKADNLLIQYRYDNNPIEEFCEEFIIMDENGSVLVDDLYDKYKYFCKRDGIKAMNKNNFGKSLNKKYGQIMKREYLTISQSGNRKYVYTGIKLVC